MATITTAARNAACNAVVDLLDVSAPGDLRFGTTSMGTILAVIALSNPAFGAAAAGVATANGTPLQDTDVDNTGTAAEFELRDGAGTNVITGSVGTSGADFNFNTVSWTAGDTVSVTALTVTMPAS